MRRKRRNNLLDLRCVIRSKHISICTRHRFTRNTTLLGLNKTDKGGEKIENRLTNQITDD